MPPETSAQIFTHIRIVMGIALGLGITRLLTGTAQFVQHPQRRRLLAQVPELDLVSQLLPLNRREG